MRLYQTYQAPIFSQELLLTNNEIFEFYNDWFKKAHPSVNFNFIRYRVTYNSLEKALSSLEFVRTPYAMISEACISCEDLATYFSDKLPIKINNLYIYHKNPLTKQTTLFAGKEINPIKLSK